MTPREHCGATCLYSRFRRKSMRTGIHQKLFALETSIGWSKWVCKINPSVCMHTE